MFREQIFALVFLTINKLRPIEGGELLLVVWKDSWLVITMVFRADPALPSASRVQRRNLKNPCLVHKVHANL